MKRTIVFLSILLISTIARSQEIKKISIGELETYISKSEKALVINFWATYCIPCLNEIPYFESLIKEKYDGSVDLILVSLDPPHYFPLKIANFAVKRNFSVPLFWLNETNATNFCPRIDLKWSGAIPATLMVNNKKHYRKFYPQQLTPLQLEKALKALSD